LGEAVDVRIHGKAGNAKSLCHDDLGRLVANSGQFFECFEVGGHLATMLAEEDEAEFADGA
jgi:hypothetical protein